MPDTELSMTAAIVALEARGYTGHFRVVEGPPGLVCGRCGHRVVPGRAEVLEIFRFEGASDPADEAVVAGLRCTVCRYLGTLTAAYGSSADPAEADVLAALADARPRP